MGGNLGKKQLFIQEAPERIGKDKEERGKTTAQVRETEESYRGRGEPFPPTR